MIQSKRSKSRFLFLNDLDLNQDVINKLSYLLDSVVQGNDQVIISPIGREGRDKIILEDWDKIFESESQLMNQTLKELEMNQRLSYGPRSIAKPWSERKQDLYASFEPSLATVTTLQSQLRANINGLRPLGLEAASKYIKRATNSGLPSFTRKGIVLDKTITKFKQLLGYMYPAVLFTRTQENNKTRSVWGFPLVDTLNEMRYYPLILRYMKGLYWRSSLKGPDETAAAVTSIINQAKLQNLEIMSIDFSAYDFSVREVHRNWTNEFYKSMFQKYFHSELDYINERKGSIGLLTPDGILKGEHGEPSGSVFTLEDNSIVQKMISLDCNSIRHEFTQVQGDDGVYLISRGDKSKVVNHFNSFGFTVNEGKSAISDNHCLFLQNLFHDEYRDEAGNVKGIYPTYRALGRIVFQERWSDFAEYDLEGSQYFALRTITILENCKNHPLFEKLVKFIFDRDKYRLRTTDIGISKYVKMVMESSGSQGVLTNQYGDYVEGIRSFETFKLISQLNKAQA